MTGKESICEFSVPSTWDYYELGVLEHFSVIIIPLIYIAAITLVSRGEVHGGKAITLYFAGFLFLIVHGSQLYLAEKVEFALVFVLAHFVLIFRKLRIAIVNPVGKNIGLTVKTGVLTLILMNACSLGRIERTMDHGPLCFSLITRIFGFS
ncbi:MAG: 4-hydroxybenzoate polyprenyltransferase [Bacteroidota bacterium]